jgi:2,4-diacetamido-2,4,6-trideoxy-beta-L-gulose transferase
VNSTYIIAEAGVNHNGSLETARDLIDVAASAGADAVKFQTFKAERLVSAAAPKADYQKKTDTHENQLEMLRQLELSPDDHYELIGHAQKKEITFLSTPFETESLNLLTKSLGLKTIKVPSGEVTNSPFLLEIARSAEKIILSTGMATLAEVEHALGVIAFGFQDPSSRIPSAEHVVTAYASESGKKLLRDRVTLLHATTEYPAPFQEINLKAMLTLRSAFGLNVGYSDHSEGVHIAVAAVALGASIVEKHFTLDKNLPGPDHKASLEPGELALMVRSIRDLEKALGDGVKSPTASELRNRPIARKSLVALTPIKRNEPYTTANLGLKRPGSGISPALFWEYLGKNASMDYAADDLISP